MHVTHMHKTHANVAKASAKADLPLVATDSDICQVLVFARLGQRLQHIQCLGKPFRVHKATRLLNLRMQIGTTSIRAVG